MDEASIARRYYETVDAGEYDALEALLAPEFRHFRPDRTIEGRSRFVSFMAEDRPRTDTVHAVDSVLVEVDDGDGAGSDSTDGDDDARHPEATEVAVRGRLFADDGEELFAFVDVFRVVDEAVVELRTFSQ